MSSTPIIPIISAALVGSVAAVVTSVVLSTDGDGISARIVDDEPDMAELRVEVASLQARNDDLTRRLTDLEGQIALGSSRAPADAPDLTAMQEQMDELIAATTKSGPVIVTAQLRSGVTAVLDEIQLQEDLEREVRRQEARDRRMDQQIERLSERLSLDSVQTGEVRSILTKQDLKREEIFASMRELGDRDSAPDLLQSLRDETTASLAQVLSADQLTQYSEMSSDRDRGGNNRGGGRGGRGRGGN